MKRFACVLAVTVCVALSACGSKNNSASTTTTTSSSSTTSSTISSGTTASTSTTATTSSSRCHTADLGASLVKSEGAAGSVYYTFQFQNTSTRTCTMYGYPGLQPLDASGADQPFTSSRQSITPQTVTLTPNASTTFIVQAEGSPAGTCRNAANLLITPPDETTSITVAGTNFQTCGPAGKASVRPVGSAVS